MKIVNLEEFRKLPEGTIFAKYEPCVVEEPQIKGDTWEFDFLCADLMFYPENDGSDGLIDQFELAENGESVRLEMNSYGRDGCFDSNQLFAIYEKQDIVQLIEELTNCLEKAYSCD